MRIQELARRLGISERSVRHYERRGLLKPVRLANGYRSFSEADLRRAGFVRDLIASGFSTREILLFADCLEDDGVEDGSGGDPIQCVRRLEGKLEQIDRTMSELRARRSVLLARLSAARARAGAQASAADGVEKATSKTS